MLCPLPFLSCTAIVLLPFVLRMLLHSQDVDHVHPEHKVHTGRGVARQRQVFVRASTMRPQ